MGHKTNLPLCCVSESGSGSGSDSEQERPRSASNASGSGSGSGSERERDDDDEEEGQEGGKPSINKVCASVCMGAVNGHACLMPLKIFTSLCHFYNAEQTPLSFLLIGAVW